MFTARKIFINSLFTTLRGKKYFALKYILQEPNQLDLCSDIDLLVTSKLYTKISLFCRLHPLVDTIKTQVCGERSSLRLYFTDGGYLKLDLLSRFQRCGVIYLEQDQCEEQQILKGNVQTYAAHHLLEHVFLYYFLNGSAVPEKYIRYFKRLPSEIRVLLLPYLNQQYQVNFDKLESLGKFDTTHQVRLEGQLRQMPVNKGYRVLGRRIKQWSDQLLDRFKNWGRIITFSGVDGVGKTTILKRLSEILREEHGERVVIVRHRPGILPILSAWTMGRKAASNFHAQRLPRQGSNSSLLSSLLRFGYYFLDYLVGQWWIQLRYCALGYVVIYDRYYFDFIADPRRSNLRLPQWFTQSLYNLLLQPSMNIFLYAKPSTILERKQELDEATIIQLTERYKSIFDQLRFSKTRATYLSILNEDKDSSIQQILQSYNTQRA